MKTKNSGMIETAKDTIVAAVTKPINGVKVVLKEPAMAASNN